MLDHKNSRRTFIKAATSGTIALALANSRALGVPPRPCTIDISFEGMMVFHMLDDEDECEVGIVCRDDHEFSVELPPTSYSGPSLSEHVRTCRIGGMCMNGTAAERLEFYVRKTANKKRMRGVTIFKKGRNKLRSDSIDKGKKDFDWIMDFEGDEFHGQELKMHPNKFHTIIRISKGELSTKHKIAKLRRTQGSNPYNPEFGFVTETVRCQVLVDPAKHEFVVKFRGNDYPVACSEGETVCISVRNAPCGYYTATQKDASAGHYESHFRHYYDLFQNIPSDDQFDIQLKYPYEFPRNHYPLSAFRKSEVQKGMATVGDYPCGPILLGKRKQPLT